MEDDARAAARRPRLTLHRGASELREETAAWWDLEAALEAVPEERRPLVERLAGRLFLDEDEVEEADREGPEGGERAADGSPEPREAWEAVGALRASILAASRNGAPANAAETLHRRLDREARRLALRAVGRCLAESRTLLRDVSHDLRSPLNSVLFLADTLMSEHSGQLNQVQRRQVGVLYTAAVTLVGLVNDLIDASRIGEGREITVTRTGFTVDAVLSDVKSLLGPFAEHRGVALRFQVETVGPRSGDRQLLSRVLINLVTNAIQASDQGGRIEVRVTGPRPGWLRVEVRDEGKGGDPERLRRLVSREADPYRAGRSRGWTHGLGLTISSRLVEAAGGSISVESEPGEGTSFRVDLPFPLAD